MSAPTAAPAEPTTVAPGTPVRYHGSLAGEVPEHGWIAYYCEDDRCIDEEDRHYSMYRTHPAPRYELYLPGTTLALRCVRRTSITPTTDPAKD